MKQVFLFFFFSFWFLPTFTTAQTYSDVWFENSNLPIRYSNTNIKYSGDSWIKNVDHQLPVSNSVFLTPKNSLEINYVSGKEGHWMADIHYSSPGGFKLKEEYVLSFKLFIQSETFIDELPAIELVQSNGLSIREASKPDTSISSFILLKNFVRKIEPNKWISITIPLNEVEFKDLEREIEIIRFSQNSYDGKEHVLFIDQIEFMPISFPQSQLTSTAVLSSAVGYERHVDLTWKLPMTPSIRYIKFYRSMDNKNFEAVAIRPIFAKKYSDIVPLADRSYYYKIAWVDYYYRESPMSNVLEAKTRKLTDDSLVTMVQKANISYFADGEEFNSGLQLRNIYNQNSVVSVRNTGVGILALISAIKDDFSLREKVLMRVEKIVSFLEKSESAHGAYPELLDGRTGKPVYIYDIKRDSADLIVNLESTGILMQALLVSKQYFNQNNEAEEALRGRINNLWRAVEWNTFLSPENYLFNKWSSEKGIQEGVPLSGLSKMYLYIMGLASPENNISIEAYYTALTKPRKPIERKVSHHDSLLIEEHPEDSITIMHYRGQDFHQVPFINGQTYYGVPLEVGDKDDNLFDILMGFIAVDLRDREDEYANYFESIKNLIKIQHRQSLETGENLYNTRLETSQGIAIYPFNHDLALENLKYYYLNHAETLWTEYGFARAVDFKQNRFISLKEGVGNGVNAVMIENERTGLIWKLFMQDPDINTIVKVLFN